MRASLPESSLVARLPLLARGWTRSELLVHLASSQTRQRSHEAIFLRQQPPESRLVKQVVGLLFVRKKTEGKSPRFGDEFRSFFDGEVGLQQKVGHQIDDHLQAPHLPVFLEYLSFSGHTDRVLRPG